MFRNPLHKKLLKSIQLETKTKQSIRDILLLKIQATEGFERNVIDARQLTQKQNIHLFSPLILYRKISMPILAAFVALMLGTGTTFAAETALPGDVLYPVKVNINEEVREAFAFSPEQKANWELERANRRAEEAVKLQTAGNMNESIRERLANSMQANEQKIEKLTKQLEENGDEEIAVMIQARLDYYLEIKTNIMNGLKELQADSTNLTEDEITRRRATLLQQQEEYKTALQRRHEILSDQKEEYDALLLRRRTIVEQKEEQEDALIERRHEELKTQQEQQDAVQERRHGLLEKIQNALQLRRETQLENQIDVESETDVEINTEI